MTLPTWRSLLFVPATAERFVAKAHTRGADVVILDLEDSIPPPEKAAARAALPEAAATVGQAGAAVAVRINRPLDLAVPDIAAAVMPQVTALMLPKVMGPEHIRLLSEVVAAREAALGLPIGRTRFIGIVETPQALPHLAAIAGADPRMAALGVGSEDLSTELEAVPGADMLYHFGMMVVAAARGAGILPLGSIGAFADFRDLEGYRASLQRSRRLGFACTACIHPAHVPIINEEYGVAPAEADRARRLIAAFEDALARGEGAVAFEGAMIDLPVVERAKRLLARAR
ncbi:HpcH/HpaI aldolase/citrate lyase family protein [Paracraurococcus ruber]|uniref:CoA ester lyase n=1 Tax=Paracraurococcus ruber TaxID=77675 RepID=A0ABS1CTY5_9PROT|nr:CoA ester lyase [Paracraurococcus ruber]MBK1657944.1 CoA ester lyase [Paracraurococcus ruber]TDG31628.1 CoA ester lyase [Paracraurococcus ruber]